MLLPSLKRTAAEYSERVGHSCRESNRNTKKCRVNILTDYIGRSDRWINNYNVDRGIVSRAEIMHANYQTVRYISNERVANYNRARSIIARYHVN